MTNMPRIIWASFFSPQTFKWKKRITNIQIKTYQKMTFYKEIKKNANCKNKTFFFNLKRLQLRTQY